MKTISRYLVSIWRLGTGLLSGLIGGALSTRGLVLMAWVAAVVIITGPWLRSSVSPDFRGIHIPWTDSATAEFDPEQASAAPRSWRWDSIAVPLLLVAIGGLLTALFRTKLPRETTAHAFGILLAISIPALAAALWNHPRLFEFFESEVRGRSMVRTVLRQENDDLMTVRAPDRLGSYTGRSGGTDLLAPAHPLALPWDYSMYGVWLIALAAAGAVATRSGRWPARVTHAGLYGLAGLALAAAVSWPRGLAEWHWARADSLECANRFSEAQQSLENARRSMRCLGDTRRYWSARGRLDYRERRASPYAAFFVAGQVLNAGDVDRARAELEPFVRTDSPSAVRDLMSEIVAHSAVNSNARGQRGAAETAWAEASRLAPWKPAYWVALAATRLVQSPESVRGVEQQLLSRLCEVGDCFVGSDVASMLGDAYFETGDFKAARAMYSQAMDLFHLPKYVNLHAQEGRLGM